MLCCISPRWRWEATWRLLSVRGRRVLIFNRGRLYLEPTASPRWTEQRRCRPAPLWRKAVGGSRTSLSLPDRISLQMSFKARHAVFQACVFVCECVQVLTISNLRASPWRGQHPSMLCTRTHRSTSSFDRSKRLDLKFLVGLFQASPLLLPGLCCPSHSAPARVRVPPAETPRLCLLRLPPTTQSPRSA